MKAGDYVRFCNNSWTEIGQIIGEVEDSHDMIVRDKDGDSFNDNDFIKSSPNIIDLIEVGDYVNGEPVKSVLKDCEGGTLLTASEREYLVAEEDIKTVVTKEQFEAMAYKIIAEGIDER